jgi:hypothetical protein
LALTSGQVLVEALFQVQGRRSGSDLSDQEVEEATELTDDQAILLVFRISISLLENNYVTLSSPLLVGLGCLSEEIENPQYDEALLEWIWDYSAA